MKKKSHGILVLLLALVMIFAFSGCTDTEKAFLKNGWDYEANGVRYEPGFGHGVVVDPEKAAENNVIVMEDGRAGFYAYELKGPDSIGRVWDTSGTVESVEAGACQDDYYNSFQQPVKAHTLGQ